MSAPVFRLKGGGWYETDFKGEQDNKRNLADRPEAEASKESAPPGATEAKTDAKGADSKAGDVKAGEKTSDVGSSESAKTKEKPAQKANAKVSARPAKSSTKRDGAKRVAPAKKTPIKSKRR
jgi:hypothetical protein